MEKIGFYTYDIFDIKDVDKRWKYFDFCYKEALKCGLTCRCIIKDTFMKLELWGTKYQFIKYYLKTLSKYECKLKGVKRLLASIGW